VSMTRLKSPIKSCWTISGGTWTPPMPGGNSWIGGPVPQRHFLPGRGAAAFGGGIQAALEKSKRFSKPIVTRFCL